jgi:hypothetical protein
VSSSLNSLMFCKGLTLPGIVKFKVSIVANVKIVLRNLMSHSVLDNVTTFVRILLHLPAALKMEAVWFT